jgi:hypothetical protein
LPAEVARSIEIRMDGDYDGYGYRYGEGEHEWCPCKFTSVEELVKNVDDRDANLEHDEANANDDE